MKKIFDEVETSFEQFRNEFTHQKRESLVGNDKAILQPARDYYNNMFHKEVEDCYDMIRMASDAVFQSSTFEGEIRSLNFQCSSL